jgi:hypothetical protein
MPFVSHWSAVNSSNLKYKQLKFPIPHVAQGYFLDSELNLHFYGGFPSKDFFVSRGEKDTKDYLFARYYLNSYWDVIKQQLLLLILHVFF